MRLRKILFLYLIPFVLLAQDFNKVLGVVTFISSQHYYVKFQSTENIALGDTLFNFSTDKVIGIVEFKSSTSVAIKKLSEAKINDTLYLWKQLSQPLTEEIKSEKDSSSILNLQDEKSTQPPIQSDKKTYNLRMSVQSYGDLNDLENTSRYRYSFNYEKENFFSNNLNFRTYFILNYNPRFQKVSNKVEEILKIYELSTDLKFSESSLIRIGRSLNYYLFAMGPVDGVQYQYNSSKNTFGVIVGSRPDYFNYWFNFKLIQYGAFFNRVDSLGTKTMDNTISFIEQTNNLQPDRRFIYLQHRNDLIPLTNLFLSSEIDFFLVNKGVIKNEINLTSIFAMLNFRPMRQISINLSYDSRRNVYYLVSFKNSIDTLLENALRQGLRISLMLRPFNIFFINLQFSTRQIKNDSKASQSYIGTIGMNDVPYLKSNLSMSLNHYKTPFINGNNYSLSLMKYLFNDLMINTNFKVYEYNYLSVKKLLIDRYIELGVYINLIKNLSLSFNIEKKLNNEKSSWLMLDLTNRF